MLATELKANLRCTQSDCLCQRGKNVHCPAYRSHRNADRTPSLTVDAYPGAPNPKVNCKSGCDQQTVIAALTEMGLWEKGDVPVRRAPPPTDRFERQRPDPRPDFVARRPKPPLGEPVAVYAARNSEGQIIAEKGRFHEPDPEGGKPKKTFLWRLPERTSWGGLDGLAIADLPAYGAHRVAAADPSVPVYIVEGEAAADACNEHGLLAISFMGGASQTAFGDGLSIVAGRNVVLWPDNDEAGRILMARLQGQLAGRVRSVRLARPPVEQRGDDAVDYFRRGGTVEALEAGLPPTTPTVEFLPAETVRVRLPLPDGALSFTFEGLERSTRELNAELTVIREGMDGAGGLPYTIRINLRSSSAQESLQRQLEKLHPDMGKEKGLWVNLVNQAIARASNAWLAQDETKWVGDMAEARQIEWLWEGVVPLGEPSVWFGDGEMAKSLLLQALGTAKALGERFLFGKELEPGPVLWIDYENTESTFKRRVEALARGYGWDPEYFLPFARVPGRGIPLADQVEVLRNRVLRDGYQLIIIDSAQAACGGRAHETEDSMRYFQALQRIAPGVTTITIAHITKDDRKGDRQPDAPFGSQTFRNQVRSLWYLSPPPPETGNYVPPNRKQVVMWCKKMNDGPRPEPIGIEIDFAGQGGTITLDPIQILGVTRPPTPDLEGQRAIIWDVLKHPMLQMHIVQATGLSSNAVDKTLKRCTKDFEQVRASDLGFPGSDVLYWDRRR